METEGGSEGLEGFGVVGFWDGGEVPMCEM